MGKKCGLPSDILVLPDFAQDEIRAVWKDYKAGNKCEKELLITEDILTVLEMFDKEFEKQTTSSRAAGQLPIPTASPPQSSRNQSPFSPAQVAPSQAVAADYNDLGLFAHPTISDSPSLLSSSLAGVQQPVTLSSSPYTPPSITGRPRPTAASLSLPSRPGTRSNFISSSINTQTQKSSPYDRPARINFTKDVHDYDYSTGGITQKNNSPTMNDYEEEEYDARQADSHPVTSFLHAKKSPQKTQFYEQSERLPFLRGANPDVVTAFQQVLNDPDIPSERRRQEEIHLLAVSFLNSRQLTAFNTWSTQRRERIKAREQQLHHLSRRARNALKRLALTDGGSYENKHQAERLPANIQQELRSFARRRLKDRKHSNSPS